MLMFPERFITVWQHDSTAPKYIESKEGPLGACGGTWWYYQYFVAGTADRDHMNQIWKPAKQETSWLGREQDQSCRLTRLISMEDLIKRRFGKSWSPPHRTIDVIASQRG